MKKLFATLAMMALPLTATAYDDCVQLSDLPKNWENIDTDIVFQGMADDGYVVQVFVNNITKEFTVIAVPNASPLKACFIEHGSVSDTTRKPFTRGQGEGIPMGNELNNPKLAVK